tara:strand:+ start:397 stop:666 length:270 start_codon:yes stop_codon:yes gene_type:complete
MMSGTGVRDKHSAKYLKLSELNLSESLVTAISGWLEEYRQAHYTDFSDPLVVSRLDQQGKEICSQIKREVEACKVEYYSDALGKRYLIP